MSKKFEKWVSEIDEVLDPEKLDEQFLQIQKKLNESRVKMNLVKEKVQKTIYKRQIRNGKF